MSNVIDINIPVEYLINRASENKAYILNYVNFIIKAYNEILLSNNIPEKSNEIVIKIPNALPIVLYNGLSKKSYIEMLRRALEILKINYVIHDYIEKRLKALKGNNNIKVTVRYFGDTPATVVIMLDNPEKQ